MNKASEIQAKILIDSYIDTDAEDDRKLLINEEETHALLSAHKIVSESYEPLFEDIRKKYKFLNFIESELDYRDSLPKNELRNHMKPSEVGAGLNKYKW